MLCFFLKFCDFLNSASSAVALVFYLPGVCTHTYTVGKQRKARLRNIYKSSKKTQYLMNTLYICILWFIYLKLYLAVRRQRRPWPPRSCNWAPPPKWRPLRAAAGGGGARSRRDGAGEGRSRGRDGPGRARAGGGTPGQPGSTPLGPAHTDRVKQKKCTRI